MNETTLETWQARALKAEAEFKWAAESCAALAAELAAVRAELTGELAAARAEIQTLKGARGAAAVSLEINGGARGARIVRPFAEGH